MADYYTLLTNDGLAYETACKAAGVPIKLTKMSVGDGNGAVYNPDATAKALRREVWRGDINALLQDPNNSSWLIAELTIPDSVGGWYVREAGIWTDSGVLYAVVKYPESFKPVLATSGSGKEFYLRAIFQTSNAASVTLQVDETVVKATRAWVTDFVAAELAKRDAKQSVRVATVGSITLSGAQTVDGVAVVAGDRVLVKDQASASANGLYVAAVGAWSRSADADSGAKVTPGLLVSVEEGTANADTLWQLVTDGAIDLGSTALTFVSFYNGTQIAGLLDKKANINSPELVSPKRSASPARASSSKELTDITYVERLVGNRNLSSGQIYASAVIKPEMAGALFQMCATKSVTVTLPLVSQCRLGDTFRFFSNTNYPFTLQVSGNDTLARGFLTAVKTLVVAPGESIELSVTDGVNWFVTGGSLGAKIGKQMTMSAFRAWNSASQSISASTWTKLVYGTKLFDALEEYNAARGEFMPIYDGFYEFSAAVHGVPTANSQAARVLCLYVNGAERTRLQEDTFVANQSSMCGMSGLLKLSAGDIVTFYYNTSIADTTYNDQTMSWCSGRRVI